jgi:hypothetical protein
VKKISNNFGEDWQTRILPVPQNLEPNDNDLVPYPHFVKEEKRMDYFARPASIVGQGNIRGMVSSIIDFLDQFLYPDEMD